MKQFRRQYVTAGEFRGRSGLTMSLKLALRLVEFGAKSVSGPGVDGARQYPFWRAEVEGLLSERGKVVDGREKGRR